MPHCPAPRSILSAFLLAVCMLQVRAQDDSTGTFKLRPSFSLGAGMLSFYGDIGGNHDGYHPFVTRVGYDLRASAPITSWLEASLFALHGRIGANERNLSRNLNFESRVTMGGVLFTYNFKHLVRPTSKVAPYLSIGFESLEFLSKTDLYDREGRMYHYWSDGTIRDIDENASNASDAVELHRDYNYETDIRELDLDGFGKYTERTWGVPLGFGARMDLGSGLDLRLGAQIHWTLSDLIDAVTDESVEGRTGDARNDRILYSSFSVGYAIPMDRKKRTSTKDGMDISPEDMQEFVIAADEDGDGVDDFKDLCPNTPPGTKVNATGCPLDTDGDGVPDHLDQEAGTVVGAVVDAEGRTITDDMMLKAWLNYKDSGNVNIVSSRVESVGPRRGTTAERQRIYVVQVGSEVEGITESQMQQLLSIPDLRTVEHGDTISFVVGGYNDLPEAIRRQMELKSAGVEGTVMAQDGEALKDIPDEVAAATVAAGKPGSTPDGPAIVRVQLGAFKQKLSKDIFAGIPDLVVLKGDDGLTRYYIGSFTDVNQAAGLKVDMLIKGFEGAFLTAFKGGKRVSLKEAGAKLTGPEDLTTVPKGSINKEMLRFRIQVGTFAGNVPSDVMGKYIEMGNVEPVTSPDAVRYYSGSFKTRAEADTALKAIQEKGLADAFIVGAIGTRIIGADEAERLLNEP
ncbi:MAG: SPOR domain-containing protein [Flavobacteriales bacterium]